MTLLTHDDAVKTDTNKIKSMKMWRKRMFFLFITYKVPKNLPYFKQFSAKFQIPQQKEYRKGSAVQTIAS